MIRISPPLTNPHKERTLVHPSIHPSKMENAKASPFLIPLLEARPRARVTTYDSKPTVAWFQPEDVTAADPAPTNDTQGDQTTGNADTSLCAVCQINQYRYMCPNCHGPYCSVACYQQHGANCTERFYHTRVEQVLQREVQERRDETRAILKRVSQPLEQPKQQQPQPPFTADDNVLRLHHAAAPPPILSQEQLFTMLQLLEAGNGPELEQFLHSVPQLGQAIERDIRTGQLSGDWLLNPWYPWWQTELAPNHNSDEEEDSTDEEEENETIYPNNDQLQSNNPCHLETLDERLLRVPSFSSLRRTPAPPQLKFHLVNVLYATVHTLRLFHGVTNATQPDVAGNAALTLAEASSVLSNNAQFETLAHVLTACCFHSSPSSSGRDGATTCAPWYVVAQDVALLCRQGHRYVGRCLLEAIDIVKAGMQVTQQTSGNDTKETPKASANDDTNQTDAVSLRHVRKKLEFFLSWSQQDTVRANCESLADDIEQWIVDWNLSNVSE